MMDLPVDQAAGDHQVQQVFLPDSMDYLEILHQHHHHKEILVVAELREEVVEEVVPVVVDQ